MLGSVQIKHELCECALETRELVIQYHKPCTGNLCGIGEVEHAQTFPESDMIQRGICKLLWCTPASYFHIRCFIGTVRHTVLQKIGQPHHQLIEFRLHCVEFHLCSYKLIAQIFNLLEQGRDVLTLRLGLAY